MDKEENNSQEENNSLEEENNSKEEENNTPFESDLGKLEHWDNTYESEIKQFHLNSDLTGYIWYGKPIQKKIINYINTKFPNKDIKIIDIGCGNGFLNAELYQIGFKNLYGMDYSKPSITLTDEILKGKFKSHQVVLYQEDINAPNPEYRNMDLINDTGTFDAFMLFKENSVKAYIDYILQKRKDDGSMKFIISSCNHLRSDLEKFFLYENSPFEIIDEIPHKSFSFGGSQGQGVTTLIFSVSNK